jgi:iron(III) transport system permease protein
VSSAAWRRPYPALPGAAATTAVAAAAALPVLVTALSILDPTPAVWSHLWATRLPAMLTDTVVLLVVVVAGALVLGTCLAWLVTAWEFPGRRVLGWLLVTPLAVPGYVLGYVWLDTLQGPLGPRAVRSLWLCALVMVLTLYPYVYLFARAAFRGQSGLAVDVGRSLGCSRVQVWWRVVLPMARPSLVAGAALAGMEVLSDVATVRLFNVSTVADGVLRVWFGTGDRAAATELSVLLIMFATVLLALERFTRGRARYAQAEGRSGIVPQQLAGRRAVAAAAVGWGVLAVAVVVPIARLVSWAIEAHRAGDTVTVAGDLGFHLASSLRVAGLATLACLLVGLVLAAALDPRRRAHAVLARLATLGYVVPGPVVAIGALVVLAALDRAEWLPTGTLLVGSLVGLVYALVVRFLAVAHQGIESSFGKVPPAVVDGARTLGAGRLRVVTGVKLPLGAPGIMAAGVVVAIDILKDLPITLLLRPFGTETLPIWVWQATSESLWVQASVSSLALVAIGMVLVGLLVWAFERGGAPAS